MTKFPKLFQVLAAAAILTAGTLPQVSLSAVAAGAKRVEAGVLDCAVEGGSGFVFGSTKQLSCTFTPADGSHEPEPYFGIIQKYGLDIGTTTGGVLSWAVLAPTADALAPGALAGDYRGVSAEATVGAGVGTNVLVGGSTRTIALQPVSVTAQTGLNLAVSISEIQLRTALD